MSRVKRGVSANKRRKNIIKHTKGFKHGRNSKITRAREATLHAFSYMFAHRRKKKGDFRTLWNIQVSAAAKKNGISYSKLMDSLNKKNILLNRKMLAGTPKTKPEVFSKVLEKTG